MKEPHTALFIAPTGVGITHLALNLLESEYRYHFDFIVIICPMLAHNETYKSRGWIWTDPEVIPIEPGNQLYYLIEKVSKLLPGSKTQFLIDDIIADEALDKCHQLLLELAMSGRHRNHSLWYQVAVISVLAVGYPMLGKKILHMTPPSIQKFDLEDT